jgi:Mrp family chromosome partitioning ATPase
LVILPVREPFGTGELPDDAQARIADTWASLRHHFDLILVDPGPLANSPLLDRHLSQVMAGSIDAALLMKNLRRQDDGEFENVAQALGDAGTKVIGVIENFVG